MNRLGSLAAIRKTVEGCKRQCREEGIPFHADALAAALGISYDTLARYAEGKDTSLTTASLLKSALQDCTASVLSFAMASDAKQQPFWMWYLRNRGGFSDKGREAVGTESVAVTFIGEGRI